MSKQAFMDLREQEVSESNTNPVNDPITRRIIPVHLTKAASEGSAETIADLVKSGNYNALDVATKIKWMIATLDQSLKLIQPDCVDEIEKHNGKTTVNGAEVIKKEVGTKYSYEGCNDPRWNAMNQVMVSAKEKMAEREKFLKNLAAPLSVNDEGTGEVYYLNPPNKSSTTSIAVTFK